MKYPGSRNLSGVNYPGSRNLSGVHYTGSRNLSGATVLSATKSPVELFTRKSGAVQLFANDSNKYKLIVEALKNMQITCVVSSYATILEKNKLFPMFVLSSKWKLRGLSACRNRCMRMTNATEVWSARHFHQFV
jgi:hypothetical protein